MWDLSSVLGLFLFWTERDFRSDVTVIYPCLCAPRTWKSLNKWAFHGTEPLGLSVLLCTTLYPHILKFSIHARPYDDGLIERWEPKGSKFLVLFTGEGHPGNLQARSWGFRREVSGPSGSVTVGSDKRLIFLHLGAGRRGVVGGNKILDVMRHSRHFWNTAICKRVVLVRDVHKLGQHQVRFTWFVTLPTGIWRLSTVLA